MLSKIQAIPNNSELFQTFSKLLQLRIILHNKIYKEFLQTLNINNTSTYHKYYLCKLYDILQLWQRVQWELNCPEN